MNSVKKAVAGISLAATMIMGTMSIGITAASAAAPSFADTITTVHVLTSSVTQQPLDSVYDAKGNLWIEYNNGLVKVSKSGVETQILSTAGQTWPVANPTGNDGTIGYLWGNIAYSNGYIYVTDGELGVARISASLNSLATTSDIHMVVDTSLHTNYGACYFDSSFFAVDNKGDVAFLGYNEGNTLCLHRANTSPTTFSVFQNDANSWNASAIAFNAKGELFEVRGDTNQFLKTTISGPGAGTWTDWALASDQSSPVRSFAFQPRTGYLFGLDNTGLFALVPNANGSYTDSSNYGPGTIHTGFTGLIQGSTGVLDNTAYTVSFDASNCIITQEPTQIVKICTNPSTGAVIIRPYATSSSDRGPVYNKIIALAKAIKAAGATTVTLTGYTDNQGSTKLNATLSRQRALEVKIVLKKALINMKDGAVSIAVVAGGASNPVASNATAAGRALNRRVEATF